MNNTVTKTMQALLCGLISILPLCATAQTYTYRAESFEEAVWDAKTATVTSATGTWTVNKNYRDNTQAQDGSYSLFLASKSGITTPCLSEGAGSLVYYAYNQNRQVTIEASADNVNWTTLTSYKETTGWAKRIVTVNDASVRYIRLTLNSNKSFYLDNVIVTKPDGCDADGNLIVPALAAAYFTQDFENTATYPSSKESCTTETKFNVDGQGEWLYCNAYKSTNESYIVDGSAHSLRMLKGSSYVVTPVLGQGVVDLSFNEGRTGKKLSIYTSTDAGQTWSLYKQDYKTETFNSFTLSEPGINRLKLANETTSGDLDLDNLCVTAYPQGTPASLFTGEAADITASTAQVQVGMTSAGDRSINEWGICWSIDNGTPTLVTDQRVKAAAVVDGSSVMPLETKVALSGLAASSTVYYRAYAFGLAGVSYGDVKNFKTLAPSLATLSTDEPRADDYSDEKSVYVIVGGQVLDNGGAEPSEVGICYGTSPAPTIDGYKAKCVLADGSFSVSLPLQQETTYYFRAYAINEVGVAYGPERQFTTAKIVVPEYAHKVYYCDPAGDDATADGSLERPFFSLQKAADLVQAGDTIYMNAGTYAYSQRINMGAIGQPNSGMIALFARGGRAVLDFSSMAVADANQGIRLTGSYWHFYGIDIKGAGDNGLLIERNKPSGGSYSDIAALTEQAHDNVIENCAFYQNRDSGLQMKNLAENNCVINCDAYWNCDPDMGDADGFAVKISHGTGNYFYGCRAWNNSDDGWDQFIKKDGGFPDDITTTLEYCWAFNNGYLEDGTAGSGNGNGFKMGSDQGRNNVILNRCLAFNNLNKGFDQNHNTGSMILNNCSGYAAKDLSSKSHYTYRLDEAVATGKEIRLTNCVAVSDGIADRNKSSYAPYSVVGTLVTCDMNTQPSDFKSVDAAGMDGPRDSAGNLPQLSFMRIADGNAKLIDKGGEVTPYDGEYRNAEGIVYKGLAPDLGCFETAGDATDLPRASVSATTDKRLNITPLAGGRLLLSINGDTDATALHRLCIYDGGGRLLAQHSFTGASTVISLPQASGVCLLCVSGSGLNASTKILIR